MEPTTDIEIEKEETMLGRVAREIHQLFCPRKMDLLPELIKTGTINGLLTRIIMNSWNGGHISEVIQYFGTYDKAIDWRDGDNRLGTVYIWIRIQRRFPDEMEIETQIFVNHDGIVCTWDFSRGRIWRGTLLTNDLGW